MKKQLLFGTSILLSFAPALNMAAETTQDVARGDTVTLVAPDGYKTYQWQVSSDAKAFYSLPSETAKTLKFAANAPLYYRVQATADNGTNTFPDTTKIVFNEVTYKTTAEVAGAQGYVEVDGQPGSGISIPGDGRDGWTLQLTGKLTSWTNANAHAVYYMRHPGTLVDASLLLTATKNSTVQFRLRVYDPAKPDEPLADTYVSLRGTGAEQEVPVLAMKRFPKAAYFRYDLQCLKGNSSINNINRWRFKTQSTTQTYAAAYLSSPSVHLNSWSTTKAGAPSGSSYDWCYQEIMIPQSSDYTGTYAMSLGVLSGYMGIQVNGTNRHDVIFSMWDDGSTDENPGLEDYKKAGCVDASPDVTVSRFGNEGTGVKTFAAGEFWQPGTFVQFITNARPETAVYEVEENGVKTTITRENTLVSAWFNALDGKGWQYIATTRLPGTGHYFNSWYSFLENYSWPSGQVLRKAYYRNGYARARTSGTWYHCNKVGFGHTDGGSQVGARTDYGQGQDVDNPNTFFMTSGGYLSTNTKSSQVPLNVDDTPVDTIDIDRLLARVDEAVAREDSTQKAAADFAESIYDKTGWQIVSYSSQETSGEGTNGRAAQIIDGDNSTYWHSAWQSGSSSFPHTFVVDMRQEQPIDGFQFLNSGGTTRRQKGTEIYASNDNVTWNLIYDADAPDKEQYYLKLDSTVTTRYFKIVINNSQSGQVHTRINEIEVTHPLATGIIATGADKADGLTVYPSPASTYINVVAPADAKDLTVRIYGTGGDCVLTQHIYDQTASEVTTIRLPKLSAGAYIVRCYVDGKSYSRTILVRN